MKLYEFPFSPNCRKVRAVAYELGVALESVHVDLVKGESRTAPFLALNPNGRVPVLVDEFHADMRTTMPPAPTWVAGKAANEKFYRLMFGDLVPGQFRHLRTRANGQPALAFYRPAEPGAPHVLSAIQLVSTRDGAVVTVDHFMLTAVYPLFGVPREFPIHGQSAERVETSMDPQVCGALGPARADEA